MKKLLLWLSSAALAWAQPAVTRQDIVRTGLLAEYRMVDAAGTTLPDVSGNGNNGTLVNAPVVSGRGITTNGTTQRIDLPGTLAANAVTLQIWYDATATLDSPTSNAWRPLVGNVLAGLALYTREANAISDTRPMVYWGGSQQLRPAQTCTGLCSVTVVMPTNGTLALYVNGRPAALTNGLSAPTVPASTKTGTWEIGAASPFSFFSPLTVYYALAYSGALTADQVAQNEAAVQAVLQQRGVVLRNSATTPRLVLTGDSITFGFGVSAGQSWASAMATAATYTRVNLGLTGLQVCSMAPSLAAPDRGQHAWHAVPGSVATLFAGTNDLVNGNLSPAATHSCLAAMGRTLQSMGYRVVVATMISRSGTGTGGATADSLKNQYNALIRANWPQYADALADVAANASLGADGASGNPAFFSDGIHPTAAGHTLLAGMIGRAIDGLGTARQMAVRTVSGAANATAQDSVLRADPSGGNVTITLPSAAGNTGRLLIIRNVQTSGANTVVVNAGSGETIDGTASRTVANGTAVRLVSTGTNWESL